MSYDRSIWGLASIVEVEMTHCIRIAIIVESVSLQQIVIARRKNHMRPPLVSMNLLIYLATLNICLASLETIMKYKSMVRVMLLMDDL
jgi:hypothetical protein